MTTPQPNVPCWEVSERWPKFCASLANGRKRCRKGTCFLVEARLAAVEESPGVSR